MLFVFVYTPKTCRISITH